MRTKAPLVLFPAGAVDLARPRTVAELVNPFLGWLTLVRRRSEHTVRGYGADLAKFLEFCEQAKLTMPADVNFRHIEFFMGVQVERGQAVASVNRGLHALRAFFKWVVREGLVTTNPAADTFLLPTQRRLPRYLSIVEQERVLATLAADRRLCARRNHALVATGLFTGLRVQELANLRRGHVDLVAGIVRVLNGK